MRRTGDYIPVRTAAGSKSRKATVNIFFFFIFFSPLVEVVWRCKETELAHHYSVVGPLQLVLIVRQQLSSGLAFHKNTSFFKHYSNSSTGAD